MANALSGFRVLEVAAWMFVPSAGAVLADWGADVIKVEHPETGDPQRGLVVDGPDPRWRRRRQLHHRAAQPGQAQHRDRHQHRRWARSPLPAGRATSDVFLTSFLPAVRQRLQIDVEHIRAVNPRHRLRPRARARAPSGPTAKRAGTTVRPTGVGVPWGVPSNRGTPSSPSAAVRRSAIWPVGWPSPGGSPPGLLQRETYR